MRFQSSKTKFDISDSLSNDFLNLDSRISSSSLNPTITTRAFWTEKASLCTSVSRGGREGGRKWRFLLIFLLIWLLSANVFHICELGCFSVVNQLCPGCLCFSVMPVVLLLLVLGVGSLEGQLVMKHLPKGLEEVVMGRHSKKTVTS